MRVHMPFYVEVVPASSLTLFAGAARLLHGHMLSLPERMSVLLGWVPLGSEWGWSKATQDYRALFKSAVAVGWAQCEFRTVKPCALDAEYQFYRLF